MSFQRAFSGTDYAASVKIEPTRSYLAVSAPAQRAAPLDRFVRSARSALPVVGTATKLALVPPLLYAGALGGVALAVAASAGIAPLQAALGSGFGQLLSLAPTAGKAGLLLGSLPAIGLFVPRGPRPGNLGSLLAGLGMVACAAGTGVLAHSGGMSLPAVVALTTLAGGAGALGGHRLGGAMVAVLQRVLPNRVPEEQVVTDPRQVVSDLARGLQAREGTLVQESERQVILGGVTVRRRQAAQAH
ncbi:hypothetical protein DYH09_01375 [bacterium CPR1]|nr:hypothetical protein [bacterium CPR1]